MRLIALFIAIPLCAQSDFNFRVSIASEVVCDLDLSSPGADWSAPGREAALAEITIDRGAAQHIMLFAGAEMHTYPIFLGIIAAGQHRLHVVRHKEFSAPGAGLEVHGAKFREVAGNSFLYPILAHAPVLFARQNTVGKFTDVPMIVYAERREGALVYTVIFSNEDGGTSTRALMARWGRTTDVEYVYKVYLNPNGSVKRLPSKAAGIMKLSSTDGATGRIRC